ncbi:MAG: sulfide/dihydroorotate dehydrogenase-like FAD/NAD-binding protein [Candidatus Thorarchaeota archaeon]|jgi:ferredoxin--NADP+ reductase
MKGEILENTEVVPNTRRLVLKAPVIARRAKAGQFIMLIPDEVGERVPLTLSDWDSEAGTITIYYLEAGVTTMKLGKMMPGETVHTLVGPLGRPTKIEKFGTVLLGGGCYGLGAIYPLAKAFKTAGNRVVGMVEARTSYIIYNEDNLREVLDELYIVTGDGSRGIKGHAKEALPHILEKEEKIDHAHFVGCTYMMMVSSNGTKPHEIPTVASLNTLMIDGTGMCGVCRVEVGGATKFACVDGPDFDGHQVNWDLVFARKRAYVAEENLAFQFYSCKADGAPLERRKEEVAQ